MDKIVIIGVLILLVMLCMCKDGVVSKLRRGFRGVSRRFTKSHFSNGSNHKLGIGIIVNRSAPTVGKINQILDHTKQYGCKVVTVMRKHTEAALDKAAEMGVSDISCSQLKSMLSGLFNDLSKSNSAKGVQWTFDNIDKRVRSSMEQGFSRLGYTSGKSKTSADELVDIVKEAPETAQTIYKVAMEILDLFETEYCHNGKITHAQLQELSDDMFDMFC